MKKNSVLVKKVLMSIVTAGIFSFSFSLASCSDDELVDNGLGIETTHEQEYNGPLLEPYGLSLFGKRGKCALILINTKGQNK